MKWYNEYNTIEHKLKARDNLEKEKENKWIKVD